MLYKSVQVLLNNVKKKINIKIKFLNNYFFKDNCKDFNKVSCDNDNTNSFNPAYVKLKLLYKIVLKHVIFIKIYKKTIGSSN